MCFDDGQDPWKYAVIDAPPPLEETMRADVSQVTERDIEAAKKFVEMLPPPTEDVFIAHDYRAIGIEEQAKPSEKVVELEQILRQAEQQKLA